MFLSCLATDICVGLGSWVETETNKEENAEDVEIEDQLEVMRYVASMVQSKDKVSSEFISFLSIIGRIRGGSSVSLYFHVLKKLM